MNQLLHFRLLTLLGQFILLALGGWLFATQVHPWLWWVPSGYLFVLLVLHVYGPHHSMRSLLVLDLFEWLLFFYGLDGISNPLIWCLLIPVILSGISQSITFTWLMTSLSNLGYLLLWLLKPVTQQGSHAISHQFNEHVLGMWAGFVVISCLISYITTQLMAKIHQQNQRLLNIEQQRAEDQNLISMATMATGLAHELGTPLNSIKLLVNELRTDYSDRQLQRDLALIDSQIDRCKSTVQDMAQLANNDSQPKPCTLLVSHFIEKVVSQFKQNHPQVTVSAHQMPEDYVVVDRLLELALLNILNNTAVVKATKVVIVVVAKERQLSITVRDNGLGNQAISQSHEGLGIGLKLAEKVITTAGGTLKLITNENGAEVFVNLPRVAP